MTRLADVMDKRWEIKDAADRNGVKEIFLVGSVARGDDSEDSDCDFLVRFEQDEGMFQRLRLAGDLEEILDAEVDVVRLRSDRSPGRIRRAMLEDAIQL